MAFDTSPLVPLSLDRVVGDEPITSSLPIFQLPIELITHILLYLSSSDIRSLALVDRDARQLARTVQFVHVKLDYGKQALELLDYLVNEQENSHVCTRRIGTCIRRLTVSTAHHYYALEDVYADWQGTSSPTNWRVHADTAKEEEEMRYLQRVSELLPRLPNLHILDWTNENPLTYRMMECIAASSIKHLKLDGPLLDSTFHTPSPLSQETWPLESLFINVGCLSTSNTQGNLSPFICSLLRLAAPTLHQLVWWGRAGSALSSCHVLDDDTITFPVLRELVLDQVGLQDQSILERSLGKRTLVHSLAIAGSPVTSKFLMERDYIPTLKSLKWTRHLSGSQEDMIKVAHANSHISCLAVSYRLTSLAMNTLLLPQNRICFNNLVALHLVGDDPAFPHETLQVIALITSLKHLWLSAGQQYGWRYEWLIDHDRMMDVLKPLARLETLAFTRDTYPIRGHRLLDVSVEQYYINKVLPDGLPLNEYLTKDEIQKSADLYKGCSFDAALYLRESLRVLTWERWHQSEMTAYGTDYCRIFRRLRWCFLGQLFMRIEENLFWRVADLIKDERDTGLQSLRAHWRRVTHNLG